MPIGNGHAPGIEIGRDAAGEEFGVEVADDGGTALVTGSFSGTGVAVAVGAAGFFAAIVFVGFLAALRAAGRWPAAFFFAAGRATLFATFFAAFLTALFAAFFAAFLATRFDAAFRTLLPARRAADFLAADFTDLARLRAIDFLARDFAAGRFAAVRFAAFFDADLFFAAIIHLQSFEEANRQAQFGY